MFHYKPTPRSLRLIKDNRGAYSEEQGERFHQDDGLWTTLPRAVQQEYDGRLHLGFNTRKSIQTLENQ